MTERNWPQWLPIRPNLVPLSPYGAPQVQAQASLNTNENPFSLSPDLVAAISARVAEVATTLNRYPDRDAIVLRSKLAAYINAESGTNFDQSNIWVANGSNEILQSLFLAFGSGATIGFLPSYSMHPLIARVTSTPWVDGKRREDFSLDIESAIEQIAQVQPVLTFITTPNNPTGEAISIQAIEKLAASTPGLLVIDEAYAEFSDEDSAVTLIAKHPHVVVVRTMSKAFSFAGVRVGYLIAHPSVVDAMMLVRLPYHLSTLTQSAALVALDFKDQLLAGVAQLRQQRDLVADALVQMGLTVLPSQANFLLFSGFASSSSQLWQAMLDRGILIRDVGLSGYLRTTIGTGAENEKFLHALRECLAKEKS
ncbi:MAG: histidinol-phosphate transaminase [Candidatus Planktophila sp.]